MYTHAHITHTHKDNDEVHMTLIVCVVRHQSLLVVQEGAGPGAQPTLMLRINCHDRDNTINNR